MIVQSPLAPVLWYCDGGYQISLKEGVLTFAPLLGPIATVLAVGPPSNFLLSAGVLPAGTLIAPIGRFSD